jgi:hypothetical protein
MRIIAVILISLISLNANAATIYFRTDGGSPLECDGLSNAAKKTNGKCAYKSAVLKIKASLTKEDIIHIVEGIFWITITPFDPNVSGKKIELTEFRNHITSYANKIYSGESFVMRYPIKGKPTRLYKFVYIGNE